MRVWRSAGHSAARRWRLPSRCRSSPKHGRGSRRRRWRPRVRPLADAGRPPAERELDEGVGQGHAVIAPGEVVEVPHVEAGVPVARPVASRYKRRMRWTSATGALRREGCRGARRSRPQTPSRSYRARQRRRLRGWMPRMSAPCNQRQGPGQHATDHLLDFHGPLHGGRGIEHGWPPCPPWLYRGRPKSGHFICSRERTDHVLPTLAGRHGWRDGPTRGTVPLPAPRPFRLALLSARAPVNMA